MMNGQESFDIDAAMAFQALQEIHGQEMARKDGDIAAKNAAITMFQNEIRQLKDEVASLRQTLEEKTKTNGRSDVREIPKVS